MFCSFLPLLSGGLFLLYLYYAQDSSKKWQEILNKLGLTFADKVAVIFSSLFFVFCFSSLVFRGNWQETVENFSSLFFFSFSSFSSYLLYLYYAQDSSKKWQEILNKFRLTLPDKRAVNFSSLFFCFLFFFIGLQRKPTRDRLKFLVTFFFVFSLCFFFSPILYLYFAQDSSKIVTRNIKQAWWDFRR